MKNQCQPPGPEGLHQLPSRRGDIPGISRRAFHAPHEDQHRQAGKSFLQKEHLSYSAFILRVCGKPVTTREHIDFVQSRVAVGREELETCPECQRKHYAQKVAAEGHM